MKYIVNNNTNPYFNLALEEYCLKNLLHEEEFFILWQNEPSVIIGKNQNALEEVNFNFTNERNVKVARRISGGGAVYHDFGNLNFTFISKFEDIGTIDFKKFVQPVVDALETIGVKAELTGRNDITVDGKKVSGNAQRICSKRLMHHGTLLFDVNVEDLVNALNVKMDKITSKGIKSVRSRVANIKEYIDRNISINEFKELLHLYLSDNNKSKEIILSDIDINEIEKMKNTKFSTWEWNIGESPEFNIENEKRFNCGKIKFSASVLDGVIKSVKFHGDYLGVAPVDELENILAESRYEINEIRNKLEGVNLKKYFGDSSLDEILSVMFG
ncbi:MAG: lipoate--protein ligase [Clostridia bacterium]